MARSVIGALRVVLGLDSAEFETGIKRANNATKGFGSNTLRLTSILKGAAAALGGITLGKLASEYIKITSESSKLTAQLRLATKESGSFAQAQKDVLRIAMGTRSGISEVADLYATLSRSANETGISQEQVARTTETITKSFRVSGATATEAAGGLRQFLQAIQSGVLRGDEFNSIMENAPRLAKALADGVSESGKITLGQLREMAAQGQITSDKIVRALEAAKDGIDEEFNQLPVTFDEAMTKVHSAAVVTFGEFDRGGQFSRAIANFVSDGSDGFAELGQKAFDLGVDIRSTFEGLSDAFDPLLRAARSTFSAINDEITSLAKRLGTSRSTIDTLARAPILGVGTTILLGRVNASKAQHERRLRAEAGEQYIADLNRGRDSMGNLIATNDNRAPIAAGGGKPAKKAGGGGRKGPSAEQLRAQAEREAKRAADALRRFADELASEQSRLGEALAELTRSAEAQAEARLSSIESQRQQSARSIEADDSLNEAQKQQLLLVNDQNAAAKAALARQRLADDLRDREARIIADRNDLAIEMLGYTSDLARTAKEQRAVETRILNLAFETEKARLEAILATNAVTSAEYAYAKARLDALPTLKQMGQNQLNRRTQGPLMDYLDKLPQSAAEVQQALERVQADGIQGIVDGLAEAATGAKSLGAVFKNVANQIIADLVRISMQKAIFGGLSKALGGLLGGAFGGSGLSPVNFDALSSSASSINLPGFATGGSFKVGGSSTVGDKQLVAFRANAGEMVDIRKGESSPAGRMKIDVVPSPYFDVVVNGHIAASAPAIAEAGATIGTANMQRRQSRRVA